jgi:hypothetical protein
MVLAEKQTTNHLLHLLLSVVTAGVWVIVWLLVGIRNDLGSYRCPSCGAKTRSRPPHGWKARRRRRDEMEDEGEDY